MYSPLQVKDLPQKILVDTKNSTVLPEEKIQTSIISLGEARKVLHMKAHLNTTAIAKNKSSTRKQYIWWNLKKRQDNLIIGDSHIRRVKRGKLQNSFDNAKSIVGYFSGVKTQNLHHYTIPSLLKEKPDIVVIHVGSNNITRRIFEDFNVDKLADEIINIGMICIQYAVNDAILL